ncbi:MAG: hydrogen peroxide-inducible genes activator [Bacteroidia bacterium]|nr:hydrogen peroxide-inducible genes activator [Bacteroidia bacterium]
MTVLQLEYIIAVYRHQNFTEAAASCNVTQPTLSMQIQKAEEELGIRIFDRSRQPVRPTREGEKIIEQALIALQEVRKISELAQIHHDVAEGEISVGIIPTLAPYLIPLFLADFLEKNPKIRLNLFELTTETIIRKLKDESLDAGILATPLEDTDLLEEPLFYEPFALYLPADHKLRKRKTITSSDIDLDELWLLNEGHCFRDQVINLCKHSGGETYFPNLRFQSGSLETLRKLVDRNYGYTILPELATKDFNGKDLMKLRYFKSPQPSREISMVTLQGRGERLVLQSLAHSIAQSVPAHMRRKAGHQAVPILQEQD